MVVTDVIESVRLMEQDEDDTIRRWQGFVSDVVTRLLPPSGGRLVKSLGDGLMLEFDSVLPAVQCSLNMQSAITLANQGRPNDRWMQLRMGAHVADIVVDEHDIYGRGVNLAARLSTLANAGDIVVSAAVRDQLVDGLDAEVDDMGECYLKLMDSPVRAFRLSSAQQRAPWFPAATMNALRPRIAVIPFDTHDPAGLQGLFGDAVADELISALARNPGLTVISRLSTTVFRGRADALQGIRSHLKADYIVAGSLHVSGDRLRVVLELTEAATGRVVLSRSANGSARGLFSGDDPVVDDLTRQICDALARRQIERVRSEPMATLESYCLLMAAIGLLHGSAWADFDRSRVMLEHLVERDRRHPAPHVWLAKWHVLRVQQGWSQDRLRDRQLALDCTHRALDLDPRSPLSLAMDGFVHCHLLKDLDGAAERCERALSESPSEPLAWLFLGTVHAFKGEGLDAVHATERALELSPLDPMRYFFESLTATASLAAGQYELTIEHARRSLKLHRTHTSTLRAMTIAQVQLGRLEEARRTAQTLLELEPKLTISEYLARSPSSGYATGKLWSESLAAAGVPLK